MTGVFIRRENVETETDTDGGIWSKGTGRMLSLQSECLKWSEIRIEA